MPSILYWFHWLHLIRAAIASGWAGGFYDRSFAQRKAQSAPPLLVGVAHAFQQVDSVASHWWDVPLDWVVTDAGVFQRRNKS